MVIYEQSDRTTAKWPSPKSNDRGSGMGSTPTTDKVEDVDEFEVGKNHTITVTSQDKAGNIAKCFINLDIRKIVTGKSKHESAFILF